MADIEVKQHGKFKDVYSVTFRPSWRSQAQTDWLNEHQPEWDWSQVTPWQWHMWRKRLSRRADGWFIADADGVALDWTFKRQEVEGDQGWFSDNRERTMFYEVRKGDLDEASEAAIVWGRRGVAEDIRDAFEEAIGQRMKIRPVSVLWDEAS